MPLIELKPVASGRYVGLYRIEEGIEELMKLFTPTSTELDLFSTYTHEQKKLEWLSARILLRDLCHDLGIVFKGTHKDPNGKPHLKGLSCQISLTHSYPYVAAVLDTNKDVGIDLEQPKEKLRKIGPRFLDDREIELTGDELMKLCIFWCAKEALYKIHSKSGLNFRENLHLFPVGDYPWEVIEGRISIGEHESAYLLRCEIGKEFAMVYNID